MMQQLLEASEDAEGAAALTAMVLSATSGATTCSSFSQACLQSRTRQPPGTFAQPLCPSTAAIPSLSRYMNPAANVLEAYSVPPPKVLLVLLLFLLLHLLHLFLSLLL